MSADHHRRDAYASAGARANQRQAARRTTTGGLGTGPISRGHRRGRRRGSNAPLAVTLSLILIAGFVAICWLLIDRGGAIHDPFVAIATRLQTEAPGVFAADELDGAGRRLVTGELERGHPRWFAAARADGGADQGDLQRTYWNLAAADLAALGAVQAAYRRAGLSFSLRGEWFGVEVESVPAIPPASDATGAPPPAPEATPPTPTRSTTPPATPRPAPEPDGVHRTL